MKRISSYTSCMHTHVRYYVYEPKVVLRIKGVIQVHHGLAEHADRYEHFAAFMLNQGFVVVVSDFAGHGKSLIDFEQGYFGKQSGTDNLVKDMHHLQQIIRRNYPDVPYFMLGVDLGSALIRKYVTLYGDYIEGVILLGTLTKVEFKTLKKAYFYIMKKIKGPLYKPHSYFKSFHQRNNKKIFQSGSDIEWLTSDAQERKKFLKDPMTHFTYTLQGYHDIVNLILEVNSEESIAKIPTYLSVYIGSGEHDPMAKHDQQLVEQYKKQGIADLTYEVFPSKRHALLFEQDKRDVYLHILDWLNERTYL